MSHGTLRQTTNKTTRGGCLNLLLTLKSNQEHRCTTFVITCSAFINPTVAAACALFVCVRLSARVFARTNAASDSRAVFSHDGTRAAEPLDRLLSWRRVAEVDDKILIVFLQKIVKVTSSGFCLTSRKPTETVIQNQAR